MPASKKTREAIKNAVRRLDDEKDDYGKWEFYGDVIPLLEKRRVTFTEAASITKEVCPYGLGFKRGILLMRARDFRKG